MSMTRRETLFLAMGSAVAATLPFKAFAEADAAIAAFTGGATVGSEGITLIAPEIAENGNTVPVEVSAPGAESIMILAAGNPTPGVATFNFGPLAGAQSASTRIRLAG
ncbi:MAG: thiosulfate oxidation carrier protein SoxY, partial [Octadecabacter sp.]|nr:thiosulfate oxidation carrier protein SoxY [Octadecabacter sp.]